MSRFAHKIAVTAQQSARSPRVPYDRTIAMGSRRALTVLIAVAAVVMATIPSTAGATKPPKGPTVHDSWPPSPRPAASAGVARAARSARTTRCT